MKLQDFIIKHNDLQTVFEIVEDYKTQKRYNQIIKRKYVVGTILTIFSIINYSLIGLLILNIVTRFINIDNGTLILVFAFLCVLELIRSIFLNGFLYFDFNLFRFEIVVPLVEKIIKIYPKDKRSSILDFQSTYYDYQIHTYQMVEDGVPILVNFIFLTILSIAVPKYSLFPYILIPIAVFLTFAGYVFSLSMIDLTKSVREGEKIKKKTILIRTLFPIFINVPVTVLSPLLVITALYNSELVIIPFLSFLVPFIRFFWGSARNFDNILLARKHFYEILSTLNIMKDRYIFNNETYQLQCKYNTPSESTIEKSKKNSSLVLKNLIPMYPSNTYKPSHIYNFEFKPGIYQLHGRNGVGKTTLLKTISLPLNYQTEYSAGELAINGKPLFNHEYKLESFRQKIKYIGHISDVPRLKKVDILYLKKYKYISKILNQIEKEDHHTLSEGEQAVSAISQYYIDIKKGMSHKILIIDEVFSRIYNGKDNPLRDEVVTLLNDIKDISKFLIVLIVDHMTNVKSATHLKIEKRNITKYNPY